MKRIPLGGGWYFRIWPPSGPTRSVDGWKKLKGDKWERFIDILTSNPLWWLGLKKYGKW